MSPRYKNALGDSFLNQCIKGISIFDVLGPFYTPILGWSEPYPLLVLIIIILIVIPSMFKSASKSSFLKISRLYNSIRLGLISLLHQVGYSYTIMIPLEQVIGQSGPCVNMGNGNDAEASESFSASIWSASIFVYQILRLSGSKSPIFYIISFVFIFMVVLFAMCTNFASLFQAIFVILLSYICHSLNLLVPFQYTHIENGVLTLYGIIISIILGLSHPYRNVFNSVWFSFLVIIVDEFLLLRHQLTRNGFPSITTAGEITWATEIQHVESIRLLNSEEEESFFQNLKNDTVTSVFALIIFYIGVLIRKLVTVGAFFQSVST